MERITKASGIGAGDERRDGDDDDDVAGKRLGSRSKRTAARAAGRLFISAVPLMQIAPVFEKNPEAMDASRRDRFPFAMRKSRLFLRLHRTSKYLLQKKKSRLLSQVAVLLDKKPLLNRCRDQLHQQKTNKK